MKLRLQGVVEDGSPPRNTVEDPRTTLRFTRGSDLTIEVSVVTRGGAQVTLASPDELRLVVKKKLIQRYFPRIEKIATLGAGIGTFTITPQDVRLLDDGIYVYDVWLTKGGKRDAVVPLSPCVLLGTATDIP